MNPHDSSAKNWKILRCGSLGCPCEDVKCGANELPRGKPRGIKSFEKLGCTASREESDPKKIEVPDYDSDVRRLTLKEFA